MCGSNICHNCTKKQFLLWLFRREYIGVTKLTKKSSDCPICLTYVHPWNRFHGMNISETIILISTPNQIFVFPNICLCWWKTSSSDGKNIWLNVKKKLRQNIDFETKPNIVTDANDRKYYQNRNSWATIQLTFPKAFTHKMWIYVSRLKSNSS